MLDDLKFRRAVILRRLEMEGLTPWLVFTNMTLMDAATLILRLFIGVCLIVHGLGKL